VLEAGIGPFWLFSTIFGPFGHFWTFLALMAVYDPIRPILALFGLFLSLFFCLIIEVKPLNLLDKWIVASPPTNGLEAAPA
jgi:hypothetical protein